MLLGRVEPTHDGSLAKRQRVDSGPTVIGGKSPPNKIHASSGANRKAQHALSSETASSSSMITPAPVPSPSEIAANKAREQSRANIMQMRFRRALKTNDSRLMITCMESGYNPSLTQWLQIIGKAHVTTALRIIETTGNLETQCCAVAIRRQHRKLFQAVLDRVTAVPDSQMESLMTVPAFYLDICLSKGLDPNVTLKNRRLPLEHACAHSRISHIEILLKDSRTTVSQNVCRFMIRQTKQQKFAARAIQLCKDIVPNMVLEAVVANVSTALVAIMNILENKYEDHTVWSDITHMMMCPILNDYTTDIVKTPVNNHYYDRTQILTWVRDKGTDPLTREPLTETDLLLRSEFLKDYAKELQVMLSKLK